MPDISKVIWSEGLFLQPQHLQQQDRYIENLIVNRPEISGLASWGIIDYEVDQNLLSLGKFSLIKCVGILPDGTYFNAPYEANLPDPIDISLEAADRLIYLALPLKKPNAAEVALEENENVFCRYKSETYEVIDNVAGSNNSAEIQVGKYTLRCMLETNDLGGFSCLALAKIKDILPNKQIKLDEQFITPCLNIQTISKLSIFSKELLSLLNHRADRLAQTQTEMGYGGVAEIIDFSLLCIINRAEILLQFLINKKALHPESFYLYLIELMANLAAYNDIERRPKVLPLYKHHDLQSSFDPIIAQLRHSLSFVLQRRAVLLKLEMHSYGLMVSPIEDRDLFANSQFIISISADVDSEDLSKQFLSQTRISGVETIQTLITHALPGIDLHHLPTVPREIPFSDGDIYFSLNKTHPEWLALEKSSAIAIHLGNEYPNLKLQLWAIRNKPDV